MSDDNVRDEDELGENTFDASDFGAEVEEDLTDDELDEILGDGETDPLVEEEVEEEGDDEDDADDIDDGFSEFNNYEE